MSGRRKAVRAAREQIGKGADWVKVYADYRWTRDEPSAHFFAGRIESHRTRRLVRPGGRLPPRTTAEGIAALRWLVSKLSEHGDEGTPEFSSS